MSARTLVTVDLGTTTRCRVDHALSPSRPVVELVSGDSVVALDFASRRALAELREALDDYEAEYLGD